MMLQTGGCLLDVTDTPFERVPRLCRMMYRKIDCCLNFLLMECKIWLCESMERLVEAWSVEAAVMMFGSHGVRSVMNTDP